jgi:CDP-glycerol glycerophosphotransferase (TagB/SpsB family)
LYNYQEELIERLLKKYKVVFRPHPQDRHPLIQKIVKKFKKYKNFIYDSEPNDYLYYYANSKMMISDTSGTAYTYTFLTKKPVLFISANEHTIKKDLGDLEYFKYRSYVGKVDTNIDNLEESIEYLIKNKSKFRLKIRHLMNRLVFNVGRSEEEFIKLLKEEV